MTPFECVNQHYTWPEKSGPVSFVPHELQIACINALGELETQGHWLDMATGKTFISTWIALFKQITRRQQTIVIMPPVLIKQWAKWLRSIRPINGARPLTVTEYRASPKVRNGKTIKAAEQRAQLDLNVDFVLVGLQIFHKERLRFIEHYADKAVTVVVDESHNIANVDTVFHEAVYDFCIGRTRLMLTGTPSDPPTNAYGLIKLSAPGTYEHLAAFNETHIAERDYWDRPCKFKELELLNKNLMTNGHRILYGDMYPAAEDPRINPIEYELSPAHHKLYSKLAEERMLLLPDGERVDLNSSGKLRAALGQIIANFGHFSGNEKDRSTLYDLIDTRLEGLGSDGKLVLFAHYRMSVAYLVHHYAKLKAVRINGDVTDKQRDRAKEQFIDDPHCRLIVIQAASGGQGLDGLQWVCHNAMVVEPITKPLLFHQSVARLQRPGQKYRVWVDVAICQGTVQVRGFKELLNRDEVINQTIRNKTDLRKVVYGQM